MIGSPDLLAFAGAEGFSGEGEEEQEAVGLPEELSVPVLPPSNPWNCSAQFNRDFILVAEFSEQVGPTPVLTIPDDPRVIGSFDLNHFSVRIMSVDYQASGPGPVPPTSPGPRLNFSEDSKVILGDSAEDAFAYVHHVTLYDLEARGMVRPFCMAYVCSDQMKLMQNFSELSTRFSRASDSLKTGNRQAFSMELQGKLQELEFKRLTLKQEADFSGSANDTKDIGEDSDELEAIERSILIHRDLLRQVMSYPNRKLKQPDFLPYDPADSLPEVSFLPPEPHPSLSTSCRSEHHLKSLPELCNAYFLSLMKEQLADTERRLRGDRSVLTTARVISSLSKRLTLTNFLFELWTPDDGEEEEEEKEKESVEVEVHRTTGAKRVIDAFQAEPLSLDSFCSCVEEIPIKLEPVTSDPSVSMEMTGSVSSGDSIEVLGTEKSYRTQHVAAGCDGRDAPAMAVDSPFRRLAADAGVRRVRAYARRANSEDSIEVLSTTESIFPDDLTAITEEEAENQPMSNGFDHHKDSLMEEKYDNPCKAEEPMTEGAPAHEHKGNIKQDPVPEVLKTTRIHEDKRHDTTSKLLQAENVVDSTPRWSNGQTSSLVPDPQLYLAPSMSLSVVGRWSQPAAPVRMLSMDESSECTSFTSSSDPPSPTQNISNNRPVERKRRRKAGLRALRFLKQNSFSQHAVFCLMSGRPLVVIGSDEVLVRKHVDALTLFLPAPGADGSAVMPFLTTALQLMDLLTWRLIGLHRSACPSSSSIIHCLSRYSRYVAVLDLDQKTLRCSSYSGSLLNRLADPHTAISRGITYLLHLESCLTAMQNHALLYTFSPQFQHVGAAGPSDSTEEGQDSLLIPRFCSTNSDLTVIRFLSDVLKQRHVGCGPPVLRFSYSSVQLHKNTAAT